MKSYPQIWVSEWFGSDDTGPIGWFVVWGDVCASLLPLMGWGFWFLTGAAYAFTAMLLVGCSFHTYDIWKTQPRPDPFADMATFKRQRRTEEAKSWDDAYCDALGFNEREVWHRLGAIEKAREGQAYWSSKPVDPPIEMKMRRGL